MKLQLYAQAQHIWKDLARNAENSPLEFELEIHKKLLSIFQVGDYYYFIFNVRDAEFEFVSPAIKDMLGFDAATLSANTFLNNIHPEDQPYFLNFENSISQFLRQLPCKKYESYKFRYDFRIKDTSGKYIRLLHQMVVMQHDDEGNITRSLGIHTDISDLKTSGHPVLSFIGLDGEPSYVNVDVKEVFTPAKEIFSKREKEIILCITKGKSSPEIADELNISRHTIDTHRKNMLKKTGSSSATELIMKSIKEGWI